MTHREGHAVQKRRSDRISIRIPLAVVGTDQSGRDFMDRAVTQMVSRFGASIVTKLTLAQEQELTLTPADRKPVRAKVIGQTSIVPEGHIYGIAFLNTTIDFWGIHFPPSPEAVGPTTHLECCDCGAVESVRLNELESEVFEANDRLRRHCAQCSGLTTWRLADHAPVRKPPQPSRADRRSEAEEEQPSQELRSEAPLPAGFATANGPQRRMYPRVRVNLRACIVQPGSEDDVANVINMSRGGILVSTTRVYRTESWIQLAVPYTPSAANIFVPARIVRHADSEGVHQYGIKYVRR